MSDEPREPDDEHVKHCEHLNLPVVRRTGAPVGTLKLNEDGTGLLTLYDIEPCDVCREGE